MSLISLRYWVLSFFLFCGSTTLFSQAVIMPESSFAYNWNVKIYVGKTQYYGDVSHDDKIEKLRNEAKLSMGASLTKNLNSYFAVTADLFYTKLKSKKGPDNEPYPVMYYLSGKYFDFTLQPRVDLVNLFADSKIENRFSVYFSIGLGYGMWSTILEDAQTGEIVSGEVGSYNGSMIIPTGLTLNYRFYKKLSVFVDAQMKTILNDQLDNWVDGWKTDQLFVGSIGISYNFDFKYEVKPSDINRTRKNEEYRKVIY